MYELVKDSADSKLDVLDFDIETRRIGFHSAGMFNPDGCEPVAVAWKWVGERNPIQNRSLGRTWSRTAMRRMLRPLFEALDAADLVTGHYIRKFDLPILAGVAFEMEMTFPTVLTIDTKMDLKDMQGLSKSQENLALLLKLRGDKFPMSDNDWREAARLTEEGLLEAVERCSRDVAQHEELYTTLAEMDKLNPPVEWKP